MNDHVLRCSQEKEVRATMEECSGASPTSAAADRAEREPVKSTFGV